MIALALSDLWPRGFAHPERLVVLVAVVVLALAYVLLLRRRHHAAMRYTQARALAGLGGRRRQWLRHVVVALGLASLAALVLTFAVPQARTWVPREKATIVVVIDNSQSMAAADVRPTRLEAAKQAAAAFVTSVPPTYNVALVSLSGNPSLLLPPTTNHRSVADAIGQLGLEDGTATGESIHIALDALRRVPGADPKEPPSAAIVLLSDGSSATGRSPLVAARQAGEARVPVDTIAYGTENGYVDLDGKRLPVGVDTAQMAEIARLSGGTARRADSAGDLSAVYGQVRSEVGKEWKIGDATGDWALLALGLVALAGLGIVTLAARRSA